MHDLNYYDINGDPIDPTDEDQVHRTVVVAPDGIIEQLDAPLGYEIAEQEPSPGQEYVNPVFGSGHIQAPGDWRVIDNKAESSPPAIQELIERGETWHTLENDNGDQIHSDARFYGNS